MHAHTSTKTPHHQDWSAVHHQSQVWSCDIFLFQELFLLLGHRLFQFILISCRLLVKLPEVDYQLKVKTTFDK